MNNEESVIVPNIYMKRPTYTYEIERGIIVESGGGDMDCWDERI